MKIVTNILMIIGVLAIIFAGFLGVGVILYAITPPVKAKIVVAPVTAEAVKSYDKKVEAFVKEIEASAGAREKEVTLNFNEQEVNSKIIATLAEGKVPVTEMTINFNEDLCLAYAVFNNPGIAAKAGLIAQIKVIDGKFKITPVDFQLGTLPLPSSIKEQVGGLLDILIRIQNFAENLPVKFSSVKISSGQITIKGMVRTVK